MNFFGESLATSPAPRTLILHLCSAFSAHPGIAPLTVNLASKACHRNPREESGMAAHAGEKAWKTGTFKCQVCNEEVRVQKGRTIPKCPKGHTTFDERVNEPRSEKPLRGHLRRRSSSRRAATRGRTSKTRSRSYRSSRRSRSTRSAGRKRSTRSRSSNSRRSRRRH